MFYSITKIACKYANKASNPYGAFVYICILFAQIAYIRYLVKIFLQNLAGKFEGYLSSLSGIGRRKN
jgi:hypothetical protein